MARQRSIKEARYPDEVAGAWQHIAAVRLFQKEYEKALKALDTAAKKAPRNYDSKRLNELFEFTLYSFFWDLQRRGRVEEANNVGKRYLAKFPKSALAPVIRQLLESSVLRPEPGIIDLADFFKDKA